MSEATATVKKRPAKKKWRKILRRVITLVIVLGVLGLAGYIIVRKLQADYRITYDPYTATTGSTLKSAVGSIRFYGGTPIGISAIFSVATQIETIPIRSLYSTRDLPDYASYSSGNCPLCQQGQRVDAICNGFGYSSLS